MNEYGKLLEGNFVSCVVYVHNSEKEIGSFLNTIYPFFQNRFRSFEFIFVDDCSEDDGKNLIKAFFRDKDTTTDKCVASVITMSYFQGLEQSMGAGIELAIGDYIFEFDSTFLSYGEDVVWEVYEKTLNGNDIVAACPKDAKHVFSNIFYRIYNFFSGSERKLRTEAFRILSRRVVNRITSTNKMIPYRKAVYANCGLPIAVVEYPMQMPIPVAADLDRKKQGEIAVDALILYTDIAYKGVKFFCFFMVLFTIAMCIYIMFVFAVGKPVPGYVSTIAIMSFGFFGINVLFTILIKYMGLVLRILFQRQKYSIRSIDRL